MDSCSGLSERLWKIRRRGPHTGPCPQLAPYGGGASELRKNMSLRATRPKANTSSAISWVTSELSFLLCEMGMIPVPPLRAAMGGFYKQNTKLKKGQELRPPCGKQSVLLFAFL